MSWCSPPEGHPDRVRLRTAVTDCPRGERIIRPRIDLPRPARVAVIGSGIAGLTAAYLLDREHDVTLFESDDRLGGHANTVDVTTPDGRTVPIDTGFIVHNERTYPLLLRLFRELGVRTQDSDMSMSVVCEECGLEYAGARGAAGILPQAANATNGGFLRMLVDIKRFHRHGRRLLRDDTSDLVTFGELLEDESYSDYFRDHFLGPLVGAVWSTSPRTVLGFPARYVIEFFAHHGMLSVTGSPQWKTVAGGSRDYVRRIAEHLGGHVRTNAQVVSVLRDDDGVTIGEEGGIEHRFDAMVVATHPDQALKLLDDPTEDEYRLLSAFAYSRNETILHTDGSVLPTTAGAQASWNYRLDACRTEAGATTVTYNMNRLQALDEDEDYLVTLNQTDQVDPDRILRRFVYDHPIYTPEALIAQQRLRELNTGRTAFAGAYHGWGFHEDGCRAGVEAAADLGVPW